ncbi:MAG: DUF3630 family protein, partial [Shewanella sp.]
LSLAISANIDFERFDEFAEPLRRALDCSVIERQWGADRHQWLLEFEGSQLWLNYEFYGGSCWLAAQRPDDFDVLEYLATLLTPYLISETL